jgi:coniferyl-aldehyde dehydrogenase
MTQNPENTMQSLFDSQRRAFAADCNPDRATRLDRLDRLSRLTEKHQHDIAKAISADFGNRSLHETALAEIFVTLAGIKHARRHLAKWMRTRRVPTGAHLKPGYSRVMRQPLGVIGIVSPWNYSFQLAMCPALAALAAGNRVMIKPSEVTPRLSALLAEIVAADFAADEMTVVVGDAEAGKAFTHLPWDHLFFTGSTAVGRYVAAAAAQNLTPVTLELGGKSPAIVDAGCNADVIAPRVVSGKLFNAGQTCIAPDYMLVAEGEVDAFCAAFAKAVARGYPTLAQNPDYTSIVSERHYRRLRGLLDDAKAKGATIVEINPANESFPEAERRIAPTLILGATDDMAVMQEEIFGPLLPVVSYRGLDEAIRYVNAHPRPLALYVFTERAASRERVLQGTISGGATVNDTLFHYVAEDLPFGGVGASGYGAYHGEQGFLTFTKEKGVFFQTRFNFAYMLYPPYGRRMEQVLAWLKKIA